MKRRPRFCWWSRTSHRCWSTKAVMQPYFLPTIKCFKTTKKSLKKESLAYIFQNKEPQNYSDPVGHYCNSNYCNNCNPTATILLILTLSPALTFSLHMQINVPGEIPVGAFSKASPIILPVPTEKYHFYVKRERGEWEKHLNASVILISDKTQLMHSSMCMKLFY